MYYLNHFKVYSSVALNTVMMNNCGFCKGWWCTFKMEANYGTTVAFTILKVPNAMKVQCQAVADQVLAEVHVISK